MTPDELRRTLSELAAERLALLLRHEAAARVVGHYDFNNTYQYVVSREETQLGWLRQALAELGATLPPPASTLPLPASAAQPRGRRARTAPDSAILEEDARHLHEFVERWRDRVAEVSHARHRIMLNVILGEAIEHQRLFEQAASGFEDVLGRRTGGLPRVGDVLPTRWVE